MRLCGFGIERRGRNVLYYYYYYPYDKPIRQIQQIVQEKTGIYQSHYHIVDYLQCSINHVKLHIINAGS